MADRPETLCYLEEIMKKAFTGILFFSVLTLVFSTSCYRRDLDMDYIDGAEVSVVLDWSKAQINPDGATVLFYPEDGSTPISKISHSDTLVVWLQAGVYSVIAFNETMEDFDNISFRNTDRFATIEAYVQEEGTNKATGDVIYADPDILASAVEGEFSVTRDMVEETRTRTKTKTKTKATSLPLSPSLTVYMYPERVVYPAVVDAYVQGANNISSAGAYVTGFTESVFLATRTTSIYSTVQKCTFSSLVYDEGSTRNAHLVGTFNCFGLREQEDEQDISGYTLDFRSTLVDGSLFEKSIVIDKNISTVNVELGIEILVQVGEMAPGNNEPIIIPDVTGSGGWQVEVGNWEDVIVPIEL